MFSAALVVSALALAGCGGDNAESSSGLASEELDSGAAATAAASATSIAASTTAAAGGAGLSTGEQDQAQQSAPGTPADVPLPAGRKIIFVGGIRIEVDSVNDATTRIMELTKGVGGYIASQNTDLGENAVSTIVLKVPPSKVDVLLQSVGSVGKVLNRTQQSTDVTDQYVDLEARITTARASVERVRDLLDKTGSLTEVAHIEGELTRRQTELERLLGQQRVLESQVEDATLTVSLLPVPKQAEAAAPKSDELPGVVKVLKDSVKVLATAAYVVWIAIVALAPWALIAAIVLLPLRRVLRRRLARPADLLAPSPTGPAPSPEHERIDAP